jgi:AcrR family transcriptional regulator
VLSDEDDEENPGEVEATVRRRTGGRSARVREAVLRATLEILREQGLEGLNFSEIGRRAGVHGTSVQRRWGSRENVLFEAVLTYVNQTIAAPNTGSLRDDLIAFNRSLRDYCSTPFGGAIVQMLVTAPNDGQALAANRAEFMRVRTESARAMIRRARERGELRPGIDDDIALELALGPLYTRLLVTRQPMNDDHIERVIDTLMRGLATPHDSSIKAEPSES